MLSSDEARVCELLADLSILIHSGFLSQVQEFPLFFLLHINNSWSISG